MLLVPGTVEVKQADPLKPLYVLHLRISLFRICMRKNLLSKIRLPKSRIRHPKIDPHDHL
jgi:hypothetical protein